MGVSNVEAPTELEMFHKRVGKSSQAVGHGLRRARQMKLSFHFCREVMSKQRNVSFLAESLSVQEVPDRQWEQAPRLLDLTSRSWPVSFRLLGNSNV